MKAKILLCAALLLGAISSRAQSWYELTSGTDKKLNTVSFPSSTIGYIGGNDSLLLKTTDGGQHWSEMTYSGVSFMPGGEHILNLQFVSENTGFMTVGPYTGNYKTTDGGSTWTALTPQDIILCYNQGMFFFDENNGFVGGSGCFLGETIGRLSNGTWTESSLNDRTLLADNYITDIDFLDTDFGLAVSRSGYVYRTTDGGINWDSIPSAQLETMNPLTAVLIVNDTLAYAAYDAIDLGFGLYISTDGGLNWEQDMSSATFYYPDFYTLHQSGDGKVYTAGESSNIYEGVIFESPGDGMSWNFTSVDYPIYDMASYDDSTVFAVGDSGYVVVNREFSSLGLDEHTLTGKLSVYPNPADDVLSADFVVPAGTEAAYRVYDLGGKLLQKGKYDVSLNTSALKSGMYVLEIESGGNLQRARFLKK